MLVNFFNWPSFDRLGYFVGNINLSTYLVRSPLFQRKPVKGGTHWPSPHNWGVGIEILLHL